MREGEGGGAMEGWGSEEKGGVKEGAERNKSFFLILSIF